MNEYDQEAEDLFISDLFIDKSYTSEDIGMGDVTVRIAALHSASTTDFDLTGQVVWPASRLLALYLIEHPELCQGMRVLELGAGVGLAGLVAASVTPAPAKVILTDHMEDVVSVLRQNVSANFTEDQACPTVDYLSWGDRLDEFHSRHGDIDVIIGADVVFWPAALPLLFETVSYFMNKRPNCRFLLSYINRSEQNTDLLFSSAENHNLQWSEIDFSDNNDLGRMLKMARVQGHKAHLLLFTLRH